MKQIHQFKFLTHTGKEGIIPLDIVYPRILKNLDIAIVAGLQYKIEALISDDVFDSFIKFLNLESVPEITSSNVSDYSSLSQELQFRELEMLVEKFIKEKNESDEIIQKLANTEASKNGSLLEQIISTHLDYYIESHSDLLSTLKLSTLFNIFNNKARVLRDETKALQFLMDIIENKGQYDYAILLPSINYESVDKSLIQTFISSDFFNNKNSIKNYTPSLQNKTIKDFYSFIAETKELQTRIDTEINSFKQNFEDRLNLISQKVDGLSEKVDGLFEKVDGLSEKVDHITSQFEVHDQEIKKLSKFSELIKRYFEFNSTPLDKFEILAEDGVAINKENAIIQSLPINQEEKNSKEGIVSCLKSMEKGLGDHKFIARLLYRDPYNLLLPDTTDHYCSCGGMNFYVELEFESEILIEGIILKSHASRFIKGFKIYVDDYDEVYSTDGIEELNQKYGETKVYFNPCECKKVKIVQNGLTFQNEKFISLKRIDVITENAPDGYFKSIINDYDDVHLLPVKIDFNLFSTQGFYSIDSKKSISSLFKSDSKGYFEVEFLDGVLFAEGYRLKRNKDQEKMKAWEVLGQQKDDDDWFKLDWRKEESKDDYPVCEVYEMKNKAIVKRIRLIQTEKTWDEKNIFRFDHFDVFGKFYGII